MPICDVPVIHTACNVAGDATSAAVTAPLDATAGAFAGTAKLMFESVWKVIDTTTYVDVTSGGYTHVYNVMFGIAVFVMLGFFMLQVIGGMIRRDPVALAGAALGLAKSILGSFVALTLLATLLEVTDQLCVGIVNASDTSMDKMGERVGRLVAGLDAISVGGPGVGAILTMFLACLAVAAAFILWISLLIRKALLLIAIVFAPVALAGASWDHTRSWVSRWATFVIAMALSKLVVVVVFVVATAQVSAPIDGDLRSVSQPVAGVVLMLMAGFAPYLTYRAISFMGFDVHHAMSAEQEAKSSLNRPFPIPLARRSGPEPQKVLDRPSSGPGGGFGGGGGDTPSTPRTAPTGATGALGRALDGAGGSGASGAAASGPVGVAALAATEMAAAAPRLGGAVGKAAAQAGAEPSEGPPRTPPPSTVPSKVADSHVPDAPRWTEAS